MPRSLALAAAFALSACTAQRTQPAEAPPAGLQASLEQAAREYGVPAPLLAASAWVQTRLSMNAGAPSVDRGYGLFHLVERSDAPDEISLARAAELTGASPDALRTDALANARGGAALLRAVADKVFAQYHDLDEHRLGDWFEVLMLASGLTDAHAADDFASQVFATLKSGLVATADDGSVVRVAPQSFDLSGRAVFGQLEQGLAGEYCPNGCVNFVPASTSNYTAGRGGNAITHIVIHDMEGSYASAIAWFQNPAAAACAHFDVRSSDGEITQQVHVADTAWHAGNWTINQTAVGIEHEGFAAEGSRWYTEAMYRSSAALVRWLTDRHAIPKDRTHIIGHYEVPNPNTAGLYGGAGAHHDPCKVWAGSPTWHNVTGCDWDWTHYMALVTGGAPPPTTGTLTGFVGDRCCGVSGAARVPLAGATVAVGGHSLKTDATGMYSVTLAPGTYSPVASFAGYLNGDHSSVGNGATAAVAVTTGGTTYGSILLEKAAVVHAPIVTITEPANGATVSVATVAVKGTVDDHAVAQVAVNGRAVATSAGAFSTSVALQSGRNTITVTARNAGGTGSDTATVTYTPPPPPASGLAGAVSSSKDGSPIGGATLSVQGGATTTTDAGGHYQLSLGAGSYTLSVKADGFVDASRTATVVAGQIAALDLALAPVQTPPPAATGVAGAITSSKDGAAVAGATIAVHGGSDQAHADDAGHYSLALPAGSYTLDVSAPGFTSATKSVTVGQSIATLDVALDPEQSPPPLGHVSIATPFDGAEVGDDSVLVTGHAELPGLVSVTVADAPATLSQGNFQALAKLVAGANTITVKALDGSGHSASASVRVTYTPSGAAGGSGTPQGGSLSGGCSTGPQGASGALLAAALLLLVRGRRRVLHGD